MAKLKITHPILLKIASINSQFVDGLDENEVPEDPNLFYDWWLDSVSSCQNCKLCESRNLVVKPDGLPGASIMVIGEGPGAMENLTGVPMVGPNELIGSHCGSCSKVHKCYDNKILRHSTDWGRKNKVVVCKPDYTGVSEIDEKFFLRTAGSLVDGILLQWKQAYPRNNWIEQYNKVHKEKWTHKSPFFFTNSTLCRSFDAMTLQDRAPESVPRNACKKHLTFQWAICNPKIIIAMGRSAMISLIGNETKAKQIKHGEIVETKFGPVIYSVHPASVMREENREAKGLGYAKISKVFEIALGYCGFDARKK